MLKISSNLLKYLKIIRIIDIVLITRLLKYVYKMKVSSKNKIIMEKLITFIWFAWKGNAYICVPLNFRKVPCYLLIIRRLLVHHFLLSNLKISAIVMLTLTNTSLRPTLDSSSISWFCIIIVIIVTPSGKYSPPIIQNHFIMKK